jgi:CheY-like chemotaxis protein
LISSFPSPRHPLALPASRPDASGSWPPVRIPASPHVENVLLGQARDMSLRCLLVDDSTRFLAAASKLLTSQGLTVVGVATTRAEAAMQVRELAPDVTIIDVDLNGESGFDLAWELAADSERPTRTILTSTHSELDLAELVAVTPVLGFTTKNELSADVVRDFVADRTHGQGCRHEALVHSSPGELAAGALPFVRHGLELGEQLLVLLQPQRCAVLQDALGKDVDQIDFADVVDWYRSPEHALEQYNLYVERQIRRGASRVRVVAEVVWPLGAEQDVAAWKRYEAGVSGAMAPVPVSFVCVYDAAELPPGIIADAKRTHPVLRTADGPRPSGRYMPPAEFVRRQSTSG